jgi:hypothetical protein
MTKPRPKFRVGDWVIFHYVSRPVQAQIVEDLGPLGVNRRRLYEVRFDWDRGSKTSIMPEDEMQPIDPPVEWVPPDKAAVLRYLKDGGLVAILRANQLGGPEEPRVWLAHDGRGDVGHTFSAARGVIGGASVPFFALHGGKVSAPKRDEVIGFLTGLGLKRAEAREVVDAVGTAPE